MYPGVSVKHCFKRNRKKLWQKIKVEPVSPNKLYKMKVSKQVNEFLLTFSSTLFRMKVRKEVNEWLPSLADYLG